MSREECSLIRCLGLNYKSRCSLLQDRTVGADDAEHAEEANLPLPKDPILFIKPRTSLAGPGELSVAKAAQDDQLDFETELALVMGKDAVDVTESEALDYVLGSAHVSTTKLKPMPGRG